MVALLPVAQVQFLDANGRPLAGGTLATYVPGTTTGKTTWTDAAGTVANTNPVVLDSAGRCSLYGDGLYRTILEDSGGNLIWDLPSNTLVSVAMAPVCAAADLPTARIAMGVDDAITAEATLRGNADASIWLTLNLAATAAALTTEKTRAMAAEADLQTALTAEIARAEAAEATKAQAGSATTGIDGIAHVTFPVAFGSLTAFCATVSGADFYPFSVAASTTSSGADVRISAQEADGTNSPVSGCGFFWVAFGT